MPTLRNVHRSYHSSVPTASLESTRHQHAESDCREDEEAIAGGCNPSWSGAQSPRKNASLRRVRYVDCDPYTSSEGECEDEGGVEPDGSNEDENDLDEYVPTTPRRRRYATRDSHQTPSTVPQAIIQPAKVPKLPADPAITTPILSFTPPSSVKRGKNRPPGYAPRPPNAFIVFRSAFVTAGRLGRSLHLPSLSNFTAPSDTRHTQSQNRTTSHQQELSKNAAAAWNALSEKEKKPYQEEAIRRNEAQRKEFPGWKYGTGGARAVRDTKGGSRKRAVTTSHIGATMVDTCREAQTLVREIPIHLANAVTRTTTKTTKPFSQLSQTLTLAKAGTPCKAKPRASAKDLLLERPLQGPKAKSRFFARPDAKSGLTPAQVYTSKRSGVKTLRLNAVTPSIKPSCYSRAHSPSHCIHDTVSSSSGGQSSLRPQLKSKSKAEDPAEQVEDPIAELTSLWWSSTQGSPSFLEANQRGFSDGLSASQMGSHSLDSLFSSADSEPPSTSGTPSSDTTATGAVVSTSSLKHEECLDLPRDSHQDPPCYTYPGPSPYPMTLTLTKSNSTLDGFSLAPLCSAYPSAQRDLESPFDPVAYSMSVTAASRLELSDWDIGMGMDVDDEAFGGQLNIEMYSWKDNLVLDPTQNASTRPSTCSQASPLVTSTSVSSPSSNSPSCWISNFMKLEDSDRMEGLSRVEDGDSQGSNPLGT